MTFENSNHNIGINDNNDTQSAGKINDNKMVISNLISSSSTETSVSSSSRRRKGNPKRCAQSTLANGSTDNFESSSTTSLLSESNNRTASDDSGIEASFNSLVASLLPSTSLDNAANLFFPLEEINHQQLLQQLEASLHGTLPNFCTTDSTRDSLSPSMIPPQTASSTKLLPSLTSKKPVDTSTPTSSNKRKLKHAKKVEEDQQLVTLPEGFEKLLEKVKTEPISSISDLNGTTTTTFSSSIILSRPTSANNESSADQQSYSPPKKKRETGRCETKATIQAPDGTILEGNYDAQELHEFVRHFKVLRNKYGFTQGDVGAALGKRYGADFSQTTISRFEALNLSYKNMCKLRPLLEEWLEDIEKALERGVPVGDLLTMSNFDSDSTTMVGNNIITNNSNNGFLRDDQSGSNSPESRPVHAQKLNAKIIPPLKKRRKRTNLDPQQKMALDTYFTMNPRPDYGQINEIGNTLNLDNDVIRVWFCNRRQKLRKTE